MHNTDNKAKQNLTKSEKIVNIVALVLCVILVPILIMNCVLIIKDIANPDEVPSIFGSIPLIVLTESMEPDIMSGDLIICHEIDPEDVKVDDVISYFDPEGKGTTIVTHKVISKEVDPKTGNISFRTRGINNNVDDRLSVPEENLVGIWNGARFWQLGRVLLFTQTIPGILLCVILPVAAFAAVEIIRRKKLDDEKQDDIEKLKAELEAMKAAQTSAGEQASAPTEQSEEKTEETN